VAVSHRALPCQWLRKPQLFASQRFLPVFESRSSDPDLEDGKSAEELLRLVAKLAEI
jgi:hypothetical protein